MKLSYVQERKLFSVLILNIKSFKKTKKNLIVFLYLNLSDIIEFPMKHRLFILLFPIILIFSEVFFNALSFLGEKPLIITLLMGFWMVLWWIFEVLPLGITALIPLFYLPFLGLEELSQITPSYSNSVIFLFLGGFIIARGLEKTKLDERLALNILKLTGRTDHGIIIGFILTTAFLSMWISNTATTVMMVPIALSVIHFLEAHLEDTTDLKRFSLVLFLSLAYSANVGGIATPIGTPPNVVFVGYLDEIYKRNIDFWKWMAVTLPIVIVLLSTMFCFLRWLNPYAVKIPKDFKDFIHNKLSTQGTLNNRQKITISIFMLAASLWIFKDVIHYILGLHFLNDSSIAILCGFLLFLIPSNSKTLEPVLNLKDVSLLPWDIVLLFGGGMALAKSLKDVGLLGIITENLASFQFTHPYLLIFVMTGAVLFLTEIMSNVALCVVALPMIMKLGESQGLDPFLTALPATLASSFAFSMPISTPPNAIVFGTQMVPVKEMLRAGILLNIIALLFTMTIGYGLSQLIF